VPCELSNEDAAITLIGLLASLRAAHVS